MASPTAIAAPVQDDPPGTFDWRAADWVDRTVFLVGIAVAVFHIYANTLGTYRELFLAAVHWGSFAFLCALMVPMVRGRGRVGLGLDLAIGVLAVAIAVYVIIGSDLIFRRGTRLIWSDWLIGGLAILLALEFARRTAGLVIPILAILSLSYVSWLGQYVPGMFRFPGLTLETTLFRAVFELLGMFGDIARISATYVVMFVIFGAFLVRSGAGDFVIDLARAIAGRLIGGPGLVAVIGSALTGTVTGSAVANTVSTGVITIPLMKRAGFPARFAAGVEASASTGGQLMPPIMGAGAFVMATYTQIPYLTIAAVSILPALLYFFSVAVWVRIEAKRLGLAASGEADLTVMAVLRRGGISFLFPIGLLMTLILMGYTPTYAAGFSILAVIAASWLTTRPMGPWAVLEALALGARNMVTTAMLLITVGLVVMGVETTGIGNTISLMLADWAGGSLLLALILIALASLVLGMGLPVTAAYIVLATLSAPALYELINQAYVIDLIAQGTLPQEAHAIFMLAAPDAIARLAEPMAYEEAVALYAMVPRDFSNMLFSQALPAAVLTTSLLSAHMIIFWLSQDSNVTPPVCLTAFAAAAIARTPPMATGFTAWRIAKGLYIVPILFAYTPFLSGEWLPGIKIFVFAAVGIYAIAAAFEGFGEQPLLLPFRPPLFVLGVTLLMPIAVEWDLVIVAVIVALFAANHLLQRTRAPSSAAT